MGFNAGSPAPTTVYSGTQNCAVAGTAYPLSAVTFPIKAVCIQAKGSNTGTITVGNVGSRNIELSSSKSVQIEIDDLSKAYVSSSVNNEGVNWIAVL